MRLSPGPFLAVAIAAVARATLAGPPAASPPDTLLAGHSQAQKEKGVAMASPGLPEPATPGLAPSTASHTDELQALRAPPGPTFQVLGSLFFGEGFRFNNPYRLQTQLGESAKTVSLTAPYIDLGLGLAVGDAFGLRHGASLHLTFALTGVPQAVLAPTYLATYRGASHRFMAFGRLGPVIALSPNPNLGGEAGVGGAVFVTAKTAVSAEIVGDLFYGASTREVGYPVYPVVSLQLGLLLDHEVLP